MTRSLAFAIILLAARLSLAETVTALSAPFSFDASTGTAVAQQRAGGPAFLSSTAGVGGVIIRWHVGQGFAPGMLTLITISGAVVKRVAVLSPDGSVALTRRDGLAAGICLARLTSGGVSRTVAIVAP